MVAELQASVNNVQPVGDACATPVNSRADGWFHAGAGPLRGAELCPAVIGSVMDAAHGGRHAESAFCRSARKDGCLLARRQIKPRLLGHWGTTPGLNFLYVHLNRLIKQNDLNMIYIIGPGHGGPGLVANTYLEGTYTEIYPNIERSRYGLQRLFRQFSWPYGIPSHVAPETPGSIHEGGELGYSLAHAYGAAFDNPDLIVACIVGDGEAETGPLAASWHSNKFLNPARDGAVLPILHLNGFKIANPTVLARISREELT